MSVDTPAGLSAWLLSPTIDRYRDHATDHRELSVALRVVDYLKHDFFFSSVVSTLRNCASGLTEEGRHNILASVVPG
jgi:hypothetical protein